MNPDRTREILKKVSQIEVRAIDWHVAARERQQRLERTLAGEAEDSLDLSTPEPYPPALMRLFKFRES